MLEVTGLRKTFAADAGPVRVIDDVSFTVPEGSCYVLLGPSGCGKTTTLRCVAGLEQADGGVVRIAGQTVSDPANGVFVPVHERPIGMVFQSYAIWPHLDVFENVAYPLKVQRPRPAKAEIDRRVGDVLSLVGMESLAERPASRLSGGQQQRVALARALVRRPALLLLDEPLSNLDARLRDAMREELSELVRKAGVTALFVTHDQAEAFSLADRVAVMHGGRLLQEGAPREIYDKPASPFVASFLGAANVLAARVDGAGRVVLDSGAALQLPHPFATGAAVQLVVRPEHIQLHADVAHASPQAWAGTVRKVNYMGSTSSCTVDVGGTLVACTVSSASVVAGESAWLEVDAARCSVFAAEQSGAR